MSMAPTLANWTDLFLHFASLSLLAVGGAITTAPDMHRYLVSEQGWLSDAQFTSSIALSQAAPGPNVLFVALLGWNLGLNAGGGPSAGWLAWALALLGVVVTLVAIMLPSSILTYTATQWGHRNRELRAVRAFKAGMAPIVIALLIATGWLLSAAHNQPSRDWPLWLLTACATVLVWRTKIHLLWLIGAGAVLGAFGWV
ncbi:chromate transporter [Hydrogenophaga aromaticivorans]|uniref:Chromate transporter n=1 Tax=Hydrogenophaga aromaticivorans TaxID=2610898 RepID=A0A7Y8GVA4_9BURK|nr:chromate transporter [Hydrogenophaga aromaticivorans]MBQ0920836.1 chromate transporter [Hydrogenophaga aromaticivorans]NWF45531.1 chromate transporter [Hydrogenophaga aromaticivorans]